jgi:predicted O-methyltransferase YrrM
MAAFLHKFINRLSRLLERSRLILRKQIHSTFNNGSQTLNPPISSEINSVPYKLKAFDLLYDSHTGGWRFPGWLADLFEPYLVEEWIKKYQPHYAPVEREVAHFYKSIIQLVRPKVIIETGTNSGYSTSWISAALRSYCSDGIVYTIDIESSEHLFKGTELEKNIKFIKGSSLEVPLDEKIIADMLVLDSDHSYDTIMAEILRFEPILKVGGFMLLHDSIYYDGVAHAVYELMKSTRFEVITLPTPRTHGCGTRSPGLTIVRKCAETPIPNDIKFDQILSGLEVGRNHMDTEAMIDKLSLPGSFGRD